MHIFADQSLASQDPNQRTPLSASLISQSLVAVGCLLGAYVLPRFQPEYRGATQIMLFVCGTISAVTALTNAVFSSTISRMMTRMGLRSRVVIPREGLVHLGMMFFLALGGLVGHSNILLLIFGLMAGPWVLNGWFVYMALRRVHVERRFHDRVMAGTPMTVDISVSNTKSWMTSRFIDVRDEISSPLSTGTESLGAGLVTIVRLPAGEERTGQYHVTFQKRGRYRLGPIRISSRFPLGIGERAQFIPENESILIRPRTGRLRAGWATRQNDQDEASQTQPLRGGAFDDEFHRIREFRSGDNPRSIHWRSTARRDRLMMQEFHQNRESDMFVLLDLCAHDDFSDAEVELAVSVAATLCVARAHSGSDGRSTLAITGQTPAFVCDSKGTRFANEALDVLAGCQPAESPSLETAIHDLTDAGILQRCRGVTITSRPEYCRLAISQICADLVPDNPDLMKRMVIVPATTLSLRAVITLDIAGETDDTGHESVALDTSGAGR
ncbi:MAG: DUF58 domain-containing protein [Fuerstiella sp.]|nr:DUF58 domain-containing protein [Fuerstiella sp.]